jgi:hypothetical protein
MKSSRLHYSPLLLFGISACHHPQTHLLLAAESNVVKLEVDSIQMPELARFPIRLKLTNYTRHKVVLVFDSLATDYPSGDRYQAKNLYLVAGQDTFFLGARDQYLVFPEKTATSFLCDGYFLYGKGHFDSFGQLKSVFKDAQLVYAFSSPIPREAALAAATTAIDTLLLPTKLKATTAHALVGSGFPRAFYKWREEQLISK